MTLEECKKELEVSKKNAIIAYQRGFEMGAGLQEQLVQETPHKLKVEQEEHAKTKEELFKLL